MENEEAKKVVTAKKSVLSTYIGIAILGIVVLSFGVEGYGALSEGRPLNLELINKLLDTLTSLMTSPPATVPVE
jgi:hypothetical protein